MSSVILGVDLVPILPIRNVITFQSDITTKECSETIENNLANWKADVVLHDGAPNVGKNWLIDAYGQNVLVVNALKIACNHLQKGGWFVTKIFRSADYNSLLWVLQKLFAKVHATKPQASRSESAEIFVVCQNYKKPQEIDPRFFDPTALFADISDFDETLKKQKADLLKPANKIKKTKAHGYEDGDILKTVTDVQFVTNNNHMEYLAQCHQLQLTNSDIEAHESTTDEIRECCKDLKVLGRKDLLKLLKWRRDLRKDLTAKLMKALKDNSQQNGDDEYFDIDSESNNLDHLSIKSDDEDEVESVPDLQLDDIEAREDEAKRKEVKRIKKKEEKRKKDYEQRVNYGMVNHGDVLIEEEHDLFNLKSVGSSKQLDELQDVEPDELVEEPTAPIDGRLDVDQARKSVTFSRDTDIQYFDKDADYDSDDEFYKHPTDDEVVEKHVEAKIEAPTKILKNTNANGVLKRLNSKGNIGGGLLSDLMDVNQSKIVAANKFFDREIFNDIDLERDFEMDLVEKISKVNSNARNSCDIVAEVDKISTDLTSQPDLSRFDDDDSCSTNDEEPKQSTEDGLENDRSDSESSDSDDGKESCIKRDKERHIKLDPQGLALATMMVNSRSHRKMIEDEGWNRYVHGDSHLAPKWFREDEEKHCRRNLPVSQELVKEYKQKMRDIDAKPIKKVMQAKARQKRRALRKMEKVKKKVDAITSNDDLTQRERVNQIKTIYKNATKTKKKEVKLVVGRKGLPTKKPTKGKYKMVDSRMKKDLRGKNMGKGKKSVKRVAKRNQRRPKQGRQNRSR